MTWVSRFEQAAGQTYLWARVRFCAALPKARLAMRGRRTGPTDAGAYISRVPFHCNSRAFRRLFFPDQRRIVVAGNCCVVTSMRRDTPVGESPLFSFRQFRPALEFQR